jgi:hypothetical protein
MQFAWTAQVPTLIGEIALPAGMWLKGLRIPALRVYLNAEVFSPEEQP